MAVCGVDLQGMALCIHGEEACLGVLGVVPRPTSSSQFESNLMIHVLQKKGGSSLWELPLVLTTVLLLLVSFSFLSDFDVFSSNWVLKEVEFPI